MKYFIYLVFLFMMFTGCKPGIPKDILQPDEMALVLHDIHIFDGYVTSITHIDTARKTAAEYYNGIFKKFHTDSATYNKSLDYYIKHPRQMTEIYTKVTGRLKKEKDILIKADSLKDARSSKSAREKLQADSVKKADSVKIAAEREKLHKQLDSLDKATKSSLQSKNKAKKAGILKKRQDSLEKAKKINLRPKNKLKKAAILKRMQDSIKKMNQQKKVKKEIS